MNSMNKHWHYRRTAARLLLALALLLVGRAWVERQAAASTTAAIAVTTKADELNKDGDCSLREAIKAANTDTAVDNCPAGKGADVIELPEGKYVFSAGLSGAGEDLSATGDLDIRESLTLIGGGSGNTIIDANGLDRVFHIVAGAVVIENVTITGGDILDSSGGGIYARGGDLTLRNSRVTGNTLSASTGGQVYWGGGIYFQSSDHLLIENSRIDHNINENSGGGIYLDFSGTGTITGSLIDSNESGTGGGIHNHGALSIHNSTISDNTATTSSGGGGGISALNSLTLVNSTLSGNKANNSGGGLSLGGGNEATLYNVTLTGNTADLDGNGQGDGGGIRIAFGTVTMRNTIIAGNIDGGGNIRPDCSGSPYISEDYNLIGDTTDCVLSGSLSHNITGVDPELEPLKDNGGSVKTHALSSKSPAIDSGNPAGCTDAKGVKLGTDQRGYVRPVKGGGFAAEAVCDIGAYEYNSPGAPTATPTKTPTATQTATTTPTKTATPTATVIKISTPTATATNDPSPTPSETATDGPSTTPSATPTDGPSPIPSATPTDGPSPTPFPATDWVYLPLSLDQ